MTYFILFKDVDDYAYCIHEVDTAEEVQQWLNKDCGHEEMKVIVGKSLEVTKKYLLEEH